MRFFLTVSLNRQNPHISGERALTIFYLTLSVTVRHVDDNTIAEGRCDDREVKEGEEGDVEYRPIG